MCPGVSERVADMPPPTAGRGPPDTDFPERPESGADFSGVLAALRVRARRADGPTLAESVQPPLQPSVQGGFTSTHTRVRTATHIATHTATGTGERDQERGDGGDPREVPGGRRQHRKRLLEGEKPPYLRIGHANTGVGAYRARSSSGRIAYRIRAADLRKRNGGARLFTALMEGHEGRGHTPAGVRRGCATAPGSRQDSEKPPQSVSKAV